MRFNNAWVYRDILVSKGFVKTVYHSRRNVAADEQGQPLPAGPYMAELDITYACNCRCRMCQRWKDPRRASLTLADYQKLALDFKNLGGVHQISIAGGEPLMRADVFPIIKTFAGLGMSVNLCTNGMLLERYHRHVRDSGATCVTISLDGVTAESHDAIRGIRGSFHQIENGIRTFLDNRRSRRPVLRVRMTISKQNQHEIRHFYHKWRNTADDVLFQPVHHCHDSYYTGLSTEDLAIDPSVISEQISGTPLEKDGYMKQMATSLRHTGKYPDQRCFAGVLMIRIDPWGDVYPCLEQHVSVGSLQRSDFESIWNSNALMRERETLASNRPCRCWYNNTALIGHYGKLLRYTSHLPIKDARVNPAFGKQKDENMVL